LFPSFVIVLPEPDEANVYAPGTIYPMIVVRGWNGSKLDNSTLVAKGNKWGRREPLPEDLEVADVTIYLENLERDGRVAFYVSFERRALSGISFPDVNAKRSEETRIGDKREKEPSHFWPAENFIYFVNPLGKML
jgi:hypothetical protein